MKKTIITFFLILASLTASAQINTDSLMMSGRNALYFEDYVLAIQYFNEVITAKPLLAQPFYYRAIAKFMLDDFQGAEEDATEALERNPFLLGAYHLRGAARQNQGLFALAAADYMHFLEFFPEDRFALINMAIVNIEMGYFDIAETFLEILLRHFPHFTQAFLVRSQMFLERAMADLNQAMELDPQMTEPFFLRVLLYLQQKNYENALNDLNETNIGAAN